jgi:hypothetical protein
MARPFIGGAGYSALRTGYGLIQNVFCFQSINAYIGLGTTKTILPNIFGSVILEVGKDAGSNAKAGHRLSGGKRQGAFY